MEAGRKDFDLLDYIGCVGTPDLFFGFVALLVPDLVMHEGEYFLVNRFDPAAYAAWSEKLGDPIEIQKVVNHLHISTLFQDQDVPPHVARAAAETIAAVWTQVFRNKGLVGAAYGDDLQTAEVTLFRGTPG